MQDDIAIWNKLISTVTPLKKTKVKTEVHKQYFRKVIYKISYVLDLHGYTVQEAYNTVIDFISRHHRINTNRITIITGKGINNTGLIHKEIVDWLDTDILKQYIKSYEWTNGNGALKIYLKRKK